MDNDALLDQTASARSEAEVSERVKDEPGARSFYVDAHDGSTPIGGAKGNRSSREDPQVPVSAGPFKNLRRKR